MINKNSNLADLNSTLKMVLNAKRLKISIKRQTLEKWIQKALSSYTLFQRETHFTFKDINSIKIKHRQGYATKMT